MGWLGGRYRTVVLAAAVAMRRLAPCEKALSRSVDCREIVLQRIAAVSL